jgi:hypothetical protein
VTPSLNPHEWDDWSDEGYILGVGMTTAKSSSYDGLTDEEADELKAELDAKQARRIPIGFRATRSVSRTGGRMPGTFPNVPRFDHRP